MSDVSTGGQDRQRGWMLLLAPTTALLAVFLIIPMIAVFRVSFLPGETSFNATGFSLGQYYKFFSSAYYVGILIDTICYAVLVSIACVIFGFPVAYSLARLPPASRRNRMILIIVPLTLSLVVVVFGWLVLLGRQGLVNNVLIGLGLIDSPQQLLFNRFAVLLVLIQQFLPFMILSIMNVVLQIDPVLEQASTSLRARRLRTFMKVIVPLSAPGIVSGFTLVFVMTASAFVTPRLVGGTRTQMVGGLVYDQVLGTLNWPFGAAMSFILLSVGLGILATVNLAIVRPLVRGTHAR